MPTLVEEPHQPRTHQAFDEITDPVAQASNDGIGLLVLLLHPFFKTLIGFPPLEFTLFFRFLPVKFMRFFRFESPFLKLVFIFFYQQPDLLKGQPCVRGNRFFHLPPFMRWFALLGRLPYFPDHSKPKSRHAPQQGESIQPKSTNLTHQT